MSGGHWEYLSYKIEERIGAPLDEVWRLLAGVEHELDWGICGDTCYECAKINVIDALEAYFDSQATDVTQSLIILGTREPRCATCKAARDQRASKTPVPQAAESITIELEREGKRYKGSIPLIEGGNA